MSHHLNDDKHFSDPRHIHQSAREHNPPDVNAPAPHYRMALLREVDATGVSGTGVVAQGVWWQEGDIVALRWTSRYPTSVVFHERGLESVEAVHGHGGMTKIVWIDQPPHVSDEEWARDHWGRLPS